MCPLLLTLITLGEQWAAVMGRCFAQSGDQQAVEIVWTHEKEPGVGSPPQDETTGFYKALWSFEARDDEEVSFQKDEVLRVTRSSGGWWTAEKIVDGARKVCGFVPHNYLARSNTIDAQWFFGQLNRFEAQNQLSAAGDESGVFLVRRSDKDAKGYVLSVGAVAAVKHFKIFQSVDGELYVNPGHRFQSLEELVEHYKHHPLPSTGLLTKPCARKVVIYGTDWELPKSQFALEEQLGGGYFADVYRGRWKGMVNVAVKILKNDSLDHREFQLETQILKKLRHRHLISLLAVCTDAHPFYIITELMEKGNLLRFLQGQEGKSMGLSSLVEMAVEVADGMAYLESQKSIHRDLAARNVLVGEDNICKVADFGLARFVKEPFYLSESKTIPFKWTAPEAISHGRFSSKSDVWSFGVLLYEIYTYGKCPYPGYSNNQVFPLITTGYRMPAPPTCPADIYQIMLVCWSACPEERPDFSELITLLENTTRYDEWRPEGCTDAARPQEGASVAEKRGADVTH
uniref:Tyrosine-protein kinase n=1 Tax=Denticeps clupeoides TaxID=299321 RepID=A0AAY4EBY2_9TELE